MDELTKQQKRALECVRSRQVFRIGRDGRFVAWGPNWCRGDVFRRLLEKGLIRVCHEPGDDFRWSVLVSGGENK